jgi:hypothetical protein
VDDLVTGLRLLWAVVVFVGMVAAMVLALGAVFALCGLCGPPEPQPQSGALRPRRPEDARGWGR